jgi:hypothetical protein
MMVDVANVTTRDGIRLDGTWRMPFGQGSALHVMLLLENPI